MKFNVNHVTLMFSDLKIYSLFIDKYFIYSKKMIFVEIKTSFFCL